MNKKNFLFGKYLHYLLICKSDILVMADILKIAANSLFFIKLLKKNFCL